MIKHFRKIRHNLLSENNFSNYLLYAIGEIVLVVIGILIALSINNWNENKKKKEIVIVYLQNYLEDLKDDKRSMKSLQDYNAFRYYSLQHLLKMSGETQFKSNNSIYHVPSLSITRHWKGEFPWEYNKEFVQTAIEHSQGSLGHDLNQSTINELKSTGYFSFLDNSELKESINNYYQEWGWRLGEHEEGYNWQLIVSWEHSLGEDGITTSDPFYSLSFLKDRQKRLAILRRLIREAGWLALCAEHISKNADTLITEVFFSGGQTQR